MYRRRNEAFTHYHSFQKSSVFKLLDVEYVIKEAISWTKRSNGNIYKIYYILITNLMHLLLLFIHKILCPSTCFEP